LNDLLSDVSQQFWSNRRSGCPAIVSLDAPWNWFSDRQIISLSRI
jgi:hypothetical protein